MCDNARGYEDDRMDERSSSAPTTGTSTRALVRWVLLALLVLVVSCTSTREPRNVAPSDRAWRTALSLVASDTRLREALAERADGEGWELEQRRPSTNSSSSSSSSSTEDAFTSPGWRAATEKKWSELGSRLPVRADGPWEVGLSRFPALRLELIPRGAQPVRAELRSGHVVYPAAFGKSVDVVVTTSRRAVEQLFVLHAPEADAHANGRTDSHSDETENEISFSWDVALPSGIARAVPTPDGALSFEDPSGQAVLHMAAPYALDTRGLRKNARLTWDERTNRLAVTLDRRGLALPILLDPAFETVVWKKLEAPTERIGQAMAYDAKRERVVLFGGSAGPNETWTWDGATWTRMTPSSSPPPRTHHKMAYDAKRERVVLFGGLFNSFFNDTWTWDGTTWTKMSPQTAPSERALHGMVYDAKRERVVLFGGMAADGKTLEEETWTWDGATWTLTSPPTSPGARYAHDMAYDAKHERVVLLGGISGEGLKRDTWTWDGTTWTEETPATSPNIAFGAMAYDAARQAVTLFGGMNLSSGGATNETWSWNGTTWTKLSPAESPQKRYYHSLAYDESRANTVLFGGPGTSNDTWTWDGTNWLSKSTLSPSPRYDLDSAYDAARNQIVLFGGTNDQALFNDTWTWGSGRWKEHTPATSPSPRQSHAMAYDAKRERVVLFGGAASTIGNSADTWTWTGTSWVQMSPTTSPAGRRDHSMAYDAKREQIVLFGGQLNSSLSLNDTWIWDGTSWTQRTTPVAPPARAHHAMAYDTKRERVVLFGGIAFETMGPVNFSDTWTWDGSSWTQEAPLTSPGSRVGHAMAYDARQERVLLVGGANYETGESTNNVWYWDGLGWTEMPLAGTSSLLTRFDHTFAMHEADGYGVLFGGLLDLWTPIVMGETWLFTDRGGGCSTNTDCTNGSCVDGVCCETSSCAQCEACNGDVPGVCSPVRSAPDPDSCTGTNACNADGRCATAVGHACSSPLQCASGFCVDGVCCESACDGTCQACSATAKESGPDGKCGPAKKGLDPHDDCPDDGTFSCRRSGQCDGTGRCALYAAGTPCSPSICVEGNMIARVCDGLGVCPTAVTRSCIPYACAGDVCATSCSSSADCALHFTCDEAAGTCVPQAAASCDGDHTLIAPDRSTTDCTPFRCAGSTCKTSCASVVDCVFPNECSRATLTCVPPLEASSNASGCSLPPSPTARRPRTRDDLIAGAPLLVVAAMAFARRRARHVHGAPRA